MSDTIVVMNGGRTQQIGTPEDIYNEPKNAFVADFIGESNIFKGIMTGHLKVRFAGGEFECVDDVDEGTLVDVVVRPEDVIMTPPAEGTIVGKVTSVIFKGIHYEIAVESGKYEMVIQSTKSAKVGDEIGMKLDPDGIHIMIAEDHTTRFEAEVGDDLNLEYADHKITCDLTKLIPGSKITDGELRDASGEKIDTDKLKVLVSIEPVIFGQHKDSFKTKQTSSKDAAVHIQGGIKYGSTTQHYSDEFKQTAWNHNWYSG
jgi:spermidine/putrescine transport system ATP-binding protein